VDRAGPLALALVLVAGEARAEPCDAAGPEAGAPVRAPGIVADFGAVPEACGRYELSGRAGLGVLIATEDFYGTATIGGALRGRLLLPHGGWLSAATPGVVWRFAANATVEADSVDISAATLGYHEPVRLGPLQLAPYARVLLPNETVLQNAARYGLEHGVAFVASLHELVELTGGYALPLLLTSNPGAVDLGFRPWRWVEVMGGGAVRLVPADEEPFESFDARAALRFYPWRGLLIDLGGAFPLGGRDRTLASAGLALGWLADR
jgi:hypothetical protein